MILATDLAGFPAKRFSKLVLALGVFDGVHLGHQSILRKVRAEARKIGGQTALLTFREHPQNILTPKAKTDLLTSFWHKLALMEAQGLDLCVALHFSPRFSKLSPEEFVRQILLRKLQVKTVILGHDSRFGHKREGDAKLMSQFALKYGFKYAVVPPLKKAGMTVSSTRIRRLIAAGDLTLAAHLLGRNYSVNATVVRGSGRGRKLGFPTANLDLHSEVLPPDGVYAVRVTPVEFKIPKSARGFSRFRVKRQGIFSSSSTQGWPGVLNLGTRPTFYPQAKGRVAEAHLLGFKGNLYGHTVEVEFLKRLRNEMKFPSPAALQRQILKDIKTAKAVF